MNKLSKVGLLAVTLVPALASAQEGEGTGGMTDAGMAYLAAAICMAAGAALGTFSQSRAAVAAFDGMARNPSAAKDLFKPLLLSLALMESLVLLAFIIAFTLAAK